jgi:osmoprotectant transport system ATP-binding protein
LLALTTAAAAAAPGAVAGPTLPASLTLREVLSELVWRGATAANLTDANGAPAGSVSLTQILAHGRGAR